jgi:hypothetical protein
MGLCVVPMELKDANAFVAAHHRHHKPVVGHRFSIGARDHATGRVIGAAIIGRPVARMCDQRRVLEVTRLVTDGTKNACSFLYSAAARVGRELGYHKIQTYILDSECGVTLRAAGWEMEDTTDGGLWVRTNGDPRRSDQPTCAKQRWARVLNPLVENNTARGQQPIPHEPISAV